MTSRGIPVIVLNVDDHSMVRYSRFASRRFPCPSPTDSEEGFVDALVELGRSLDHRPVFIPTGDAEVLALSRHREALLPYYHLPVSSFDTVDILVNKKRFFQDLIGRGIPCPRTCFPGTPDEIRETADGIGYPLIVKAAYSHQFIREFTKKVFVIHSRSELEAAIGLLNEARLDFFLQEIVPGDTLYLFYAYFNHQSVPLATCGYDKVRQFPKDFGIGTICRSKHRPDPIQAAVAYLQRIGYHGLAEPEFKLDPRDGCYKLIEINSRTVTMTLLAKACGVHMEYLAYRDLISGNVEPSGPATEGTVWIDEINELHYQLSRIRRGHFDLFQLPKLLKGKKVFACASAADPLPLIIGLAHFFAERFKSPRQVDAMLGI
jgi:predicted ATP-grasp superfamily ATP-dependent carboligase